MLQRIEFEDEPEEAALAPVPEFLEPGRPVWVYSKSQKPYLYRPWMNPCSPGEWPYDLQALRGTEDYEDILEWYAQKHPHLLREDFWVVDRELARCAGDRQISVRVIQDPEEHNLSLQFTLFGYALDSEYPHPEIEAFEALYTTVPAIDRLWLIAFVRVWPGRFEDRHLVR
ncbi:hypothetical protein PV762_20720 [Mitsuaria sp. CC2]|uniref:hypothetical protein n=1 Tax=Mitsuaria sp. CC2 TaxID=3029186 RepID=UPI003B8CB977